MKKLISRNPVLRFKEGRKIQLARKGYWLMGDNTWRIGDISSDGDFFYEGSRLVTPEKVIPQRDGRTIAKINGLWYNLNGLRVVNFVSTPQTLSNTDSSQNTKRLTSKTNWNLKYNDFYSTLSDAEKEYLTQNNITSAGLLQQHLADKGFGKYLGKWGVDSHWGSASTNAWNAFKSTIPTTAQPAKPEPTKPVEAPTAQPVLPTTPNYGYRTDFNYSASNSAIRGFGFNNYAGLLNFVRANADNLFAKDLVLRFGDVNKWDQGTVEGALGVKGTYRRGAGGDYSDIMRSMAGWAGAQNGAYDRNELATRTGADGTVYSNARVKELFDKVKLQPQQYKFTTLFNKKGGRLPSRNPVVRFKMRGGELSFFAQEAS